MTSDFHERARRLRNAVEPVAAGVYFAPEAHAEYQALGFEGSPVTRDGFARPDLKAYCTSRGACMGRVAGEVAAATFGCFNPKAVVPAVEAGWKITTREAVLDARERAATAILGDDPDELLAHRPQHRRRSPLRLRPDHRHRRRTVREHDMTEHPPQQQPGSA